MHTVRNFAQLRALFRQPRVFSYGFGGGASRRPAGTLRRTFAPRPSFVVVDGGAGNTPDRVIRYQQFVLQSPSFVYTCGFKVLKDAQSLGLLSGYAYAAFDTLESLGTKNEIAQVTAYVRAQVKLINLGLKYEKRFFQ